MYHEPVGRERLATLPASSRSAGRVRKAVDEDAVEGVCESPSRSAAGDGCADEEAVAVVGVGGICWLPAEDAGVWKAERTWAQVVCNVKRYDLCLLYVRLDTGVSRPWQCFLQLQIPHLSPRVLTWIWKFRMIFHVCSRQGQCL